MNETAQARGDTAVLPDVQELSNPQEPVSGLDGSTVRLDQLPDLTAYFVAEQEAAMDE